ncbi:MAG TPA: hypothetical protein VE642_06395, partial [Pyrinomonadaceae bacterium]|nr:hypothetical protein [Pyrinomonadaceae bacterium]
GTSMKRKAALFAFFAVASEYMFTGGAGRHASAAPQESQQSAQAGGDSLVYADFENVQDKRPLSNRGGAVQLISYQESTPSKFKGLANSSPPAPEVVRLKPDDPNHSIAFDYELYSPNQYAGVGVEVHGQADKDGKPVADDVSAYKYLSMQIYATGVQALRVELISRGQGISLSGGFPQATFKIKPGFNTYRLPLGSMSQPQWVQERVGTKDVLKKLTSISLTAYCEQCAPVHGTVVVDNIAFQK